MFADISELLGEKKDWTNRQVRYLLFIVSANSVAIDVVIDVAPN